MGWFSRDQKGIQTPTDNKKEMPETRTKPYLAISGQWRKITWKNDQTKTRTNTTHRKTVMFTGGLNKMSRAEAKALVEKEGGKILGTDRKK